MFRWASWMLPSRNTSRCPSNRACFSFLVRVRANAARLFSVSLTILLFGFRAAYSSTSLLCVRKSAFPVMVSKGVNSMTFREVRYWSMIPMTCFSYVACCLGFSSSHDRRAGALASSWYVPKWLNLAPMVSVRSSFLTNRIFFPSSFLVSFWFFRLARGLNRSYIRLMRWADVNAYFFFGFSSVGTTGSGVSLTVRLSDKGWGLNARVLRVRGVRVSSRSRSNGTCSNGFLCSVERERDVSARWSANDSAPRLGVGVSGAFFSRWWSIHFCFLARAISICCRCISCPRLRASFRSCFPKRLDLSRCLSFRLIPPGMALFFCGTDPFPFNLRSSFRAMCFSGVCDSYRLGFIGSK